MDDDQVRLVEGEQVGSQRDLEQPSELLHLAPSSSRLLGQTGAQKGLANGELSPAGNSMDRQAATSYWWRTVNSKVGVKPRDHFRRELFV